MINHPPKRRRVTYASGIRPASTSTLCASSLKLLHGIISYCTRILAEMVYLIFVKMGGGGGSIHPLKNYGGFCELSLNDFSCITIWQK